MSVSFCSTLLGIVLNPAVICPELEEPELSALGVAVGVAELPEVVPPGLPALGVDVGVAELPEVVPPGLLGFGVGVRVGELPELVPPNVPAGAALWASTGTRPDRKGSPSG